MNTAITEAHVERGSVRLHYLLHRGDQSLTPLVYVPGSLGNAEDFRTEMRRLAPRTTVAISPRGLGGSSAPEQGYSLHDRVQDLEAVLAELRLPPACLMAFSAGVPVALAYAVRRPDRVKSLILLDYPARSKRLTQQWADQARPFAAERGVPEHVVKAMIADSTDVELWEDIRGIACPALLVIGGKSNYVTDEDLRRYREALPQPEVEQFEYSGHEVFRPDYERFMRVIERFLGRSD
ncbi:MAG: alpha/beta hydrolase [Trueperaceae bacterium]